ncbi:MAG TPA: hypothetical protein PKA41_12490, partial [Verrucomicrobiota bacterium]|nr:hypothetical protein [Verrucomicrobiota bacterium]
MYECGWFSSTGQPWSHEYSRRLAAVCAPDVANTATLFAAIDGAFLPRTGWTLVGRWANSAPTIKERPANEIIVGYSLSARISKSFSPVKQGQIPIARREQIGGLIKYTFSILIMAATLCHGQGVFTVNFNGPPIVNPFTRQIVQQYDEAGMTFWSP